jgi:hypothetical protein
MLAGLLFGLIGVIWLAAGLAALIAPAWWRDRIGRWMDVPLSRFLLMHAMMLAGLILMAGMSDRESWFWVTVGAVLVMLALARLGRPDPDGGRLPNRLAHGPLWMSRLSGVAFVLLSAWLLVEAWRRVP